jgi:ubiquinone/menaquinone biosynthesis C-methylase UbiE
MTEKDLAPGQLLDISGYYWKTCTLHAAVKLNVFGLIGDEQLTAETLADRLGADKDGLERLLNALAAMALIRKSGGCFENTRTGKQYLCPDSPDYIGWMIMHHHHLLPSWSQLDQAVVSGRPVGDSAAKTSEEWREAFLKGMHTNARLQAPAVAADVELTGRKNLLDLGGGPATYAIHFCKENPGLNAVVFDLPDARPIAEENIKREGLTERIGFQDGDFHKDAIDGEFDAVWLSHILHGESPADCRKILAKAASAVSRGGIILVHDFILNDQMDGPLFPALFSLNMLVATPSGRAYSEIELREMFSNAGARDISRLRFRGPADSAIMMGIFD